MYHRRHWLDTKGNSIPNLCLISKLKMDPPDLEKKSHNKNCKSKQELFMSRKNKDEFTREDLSDLAELHPPTLMPNGNVGTPTNIFMEFINDCKLPPGVIGKLGLTFPNKRGKRIYSSVPLDYGESVVKGNNDDYDAIITRKGQLIERVNASSLRCTGSCTDDNISTLDNEERVEDNTSEQDIDECEEWERHEALHDDPANYERNKERVFEEELEVVWEKGGSGLVFYTDAQFWRNKDDGDFDEQTADDWDVDMSGYYESGGGDKDARDYIEIRQEQRRRKGQETTDRFMAGLNTGTFERHTKGIGRRVLEKHGWQEGKGLGDTVTGMADALDNDGQKPYDKRGLGYLGEKIERFGMKMKKIRGDEPIISTVYDNPSETDPGDLLLRRANPHNIKYRTVGTGVLFHKARLPSKKSKME